jgi:hypothetical protein
MSHDDMTIDVYLHLISKGFTPGSAKFTIRNMLPVDVVIYYQVNCSA